MHRVSPTTSPPRAAWPNTPIHRALRALGSSPRDAADTSHSAADGAVVVSPHSATPISRASATDIYFLSLDNAIKTLQWSTDE